MEEEGTYCIEYLTFVILMYNSDLCSHMAHMGLHMHSCLDLQMLGEGLCKGRRQSMTLVYCVNCRELSLSPAFSLEGRMVCVRWCCFQF